MCLLRPRAAIPSAPTAFLLLALVAFCAAPAWSHGGPEEAALSPLGFEEHLGQSIPADLAFVNEDGKPVTLTSRLGKPLILVLGYYLCKNECNTLYVGLSRGLSGLEARVLLQ